MAGHSPRSMWANLASRRGEVLKQSAFPRRGSGASTYLQTSISGGMGGKLGEEILKKRAIDIMEKGYNKRDSKDVEYLAEFLTKSYTFFSHLHPDVILSIAANVGYKKLARGDVVFCEGDSGDTAYLVLTGGCDLLRKVNVEPPSPGRRRSAAAAEARDRLKRMSSHAAAQGEGLRRVSSSGRDGGPTSAAAAAAAVVAAEESALSSKLKTQSSRKIGRTTTFRKAMDRGGQAQPAGFANVTGRAAKAYQEKIKQYGENVGHLKTGDMFGERSIMFPARRHGSTAVVSSSNGVELVTIDRPTYLQYMKPKPGRLLHSTAGVTSILQKEPAKRSMTDVSKLMMVVAGVDIVKTLSEPLQERVAQAITYRLAKRGEIVCREGDPGDCMYFILDGDVSVHTASGRKRADARLTDMEVMKALGAANAHGASKRKKGNALLKNTAHAVVAKLRILGKGSLNQGGGGDFWSGDAGDPMSPRGGRSPSSLKAVAAALGGGGRRAGGGANGLAKAFAKALHGAEQDAQPTREFVQLPEPPEPGEGDPEGAARDERDPVVAGSEAAFGPCVRVLHAGTAFAEYALLSTHARRTASCVAVQDTHLVVLTREDYKNTVIAVHRENLDRRSEFVRGLSMFHGLDRDVEAKVVSSLTPRRVDRGIRLFEVGAPAKAIFFVVSGELSMSVPLEAVRRLEDGDDHGGDAPAGGPAAPRQPAGPRPASSRRAGGAEGGGRAGLRIRDGKVCLGGALHPTPKKQPPKMVPIASLGPGSYFGEDMLSETQVHECQVSSHAGADVLEMALADFQALPIEAQESIAVAMIERLEVRQDRVRDSTGRPWLEAVAARGALGSVVPPATSDPTGLEGPREPGRAVPSRSPSRSPSPSRVHLSPRSPLQLARIGPPSPRREEPAEPSSPVAVASAETCYFGPDVRLTHGELPEVMLGLTPRAVARTGKDGASSATNVVHFGAELDVLDVVEGFHKPAVNKFRPELLHTFDSGMARLLGSIENASWTVGSTIHRPPGQTHAAGSPDPAPPADPAPAPPEDPPAAPSSSGPGDVGEAAAAAADAADAADASPGELTPGRAVDISVTVPVVGWMPPNPTAAFTEAGDPAFTCLEMPVAEKPESRSASVSPPPRRGGGASPPPRADASAAARPPGSVPGKRRVSESLEPWGQGGAATAEAAEGDRIHNPLAYAPRDESYRWHTAEANESAQPIDLRLTELWRRSHSSRGARKVKPSGGFSPRPPASARFSPSSDDRERLLRQRRDAHAGGEGGRRAEAVAMGGGGAGVPRTSALIMAPGRIEDARERRHKAWGWNSPHHPRLLAHRHRPYSAAPGLSAARALNFRAGAQPGAARRRPGGEGGGPAPAPKGGARPASAKPYWAREPPPVGASLQLFLRGETDAEDVHLDATGTSLEMHLHHAPSPSPPEAHTVRIPSGAPSSVSSYVPGSGGGGGLNPLESRATAMHRPTEDGAGLQGGGAASLPGVRAALT